MTRDAYLPIVGVQFDQSFDDNLDGPADSKIYLARL